MQVCCRWLPVGFNTPVCFCTRRKWGVFKARLSISGWPAGLWACTRTHSSHLMRTKTPPTFLQPPLMFAISAPSHSPTLRPNRATFNWFKQFESRTAWLPVSDATAGRGSCLLRIHGLSLFWTLNLQSAKVVWSEHQKRRHFGALFELTGWRMVFIIICNFCWHLRFLVGFSQTKL